jgi:hypothetical protein
MINKASNSYRLQGTAVGAPAQPSDSPRKISPGVRPGVGPMDSFAQGTASAPTLPVLPPGGTGGAPVIPAPQVEKTQQDLVETREQLGNAMETLARDQALARNPLWWLFHQGAVNQDQQRIDHLNGQLNGLLSDQTAETAKFGAAQVETARFQAFSQQLGVLEKKYGKKEAARLARQVYYDSGVWDLNTNSLPASSAARLATGLPPKNEAQSMMTPNGQVIDMTHVAVAMDWALNPPRLSGMNPADATLVGDLAQTSLNTAVSAKNFHNIQDAAASNFGTYASTNQLRGDIDGLNLAARLSQDPKASLSDTFNAYFQAGPSDPIGEFAASSPFVERDQNGPVVNSSGNYVTDLPVLANATIQFARYIRDGERLEDAGKGNYGSVDSARVTDKQIDQAAAAVMGQWVQWFNQEQAQERGISTPIAVDPRGRGRLS